MRAGAIAWRDTERLHRNLDRPSRVLADADAVQGAIGLAERGAFMRAVRRPSAAICEPPIKIIGVLSPPNAPAKLQRGHIRVIAKRSQFNKTFDSFSVR